MPSFDVVSDFDAHEASNGVDIDLPPQYENLRDQTAD